MLWKFDKKLTKFILKAQSIHGNTYDYSKVKYINNKLKVIIICPIHGEFHQRPDQHATSKGLAGNHRGCTQCYYEKSRHNAYDYIESLKIIHHNKYDYSQANYISTYKKITIICPEHGKFEQIPNAHRRGHGCKKCAINDSKISLELFIKESNILHNNKYDYSKIQNFKDGSSIVLITCPEHGDFTQSVSTHMRRSGCFRCGMEVRSLTKLNFTKKAKIIHNDKYDYSLLPDQKVLPTDLQLSIICPEHGIFQQSTDQHLKAITGCRQCFSLSRTKTLDQFVENSKKIYGDKFDFSNSHYIGVQKKIKIICPDHGEFETTPNSFLAGKHGCKKCACNSMALTKEQFVNNAIKKHGNFYDYSKVIYTREQNIVIITCPEHGDFEQTPNQHLDTEGCPFCSKRRISRGEKFIMRLCKKLEISFIKEATFPNCRLTYPLRFDFYLSKYNMCIEFDGGQHFSSVDFFGGEEGFKSTQKRDSIKNKFCLDNNIKLIRIPYWEYDNIETILEEILQNDNFSVCSSNLRNLKQKENNASFNSTRYSQYARIAS